EEAVARRRRRDHGHRRLRVAAEEHHEEVALLRLRGHAGRWARALDVEDDERELEGDAEADRLALEDDTGACGGRDPERASERRAERGSRGGDLVLGLERADAELLVAGELLEDSRRWRDRICAEEDRQAALDARGDQSEREGLVAGDVPVQAW